MSRNYARSNRKLQKSQGAVLVVAMIFLLLLALVATTVMQTSVLEFQMAGNDQFREEAFQRSQAVATVIASDLDNMPVTGDVGYKICKAGSSDTDCDETIISLPSDIATVPSGVTLEYYAERQGPLFAPMPFRLDEDQASSVIIYEAAIFEVNAGYEGGDVRLGNAEVVSGVAVKVSK